MISWLAVLQENFILFIYLIAIFAQYSHFKTNVPYSESGWKDMVVGWFKLMKVGILNKNDTSV